MPEQSQTAATTSSSTVSIGRLTGLLEGFGLKHSARDLPDILEKAELNELTFREFSLELLLTEARGRNERRRKRNYAAAHFPPDIRSIDEFDISELESGITEGQIKRLKELNWIDTHGNIIFAGPPGLGKTMLACGLGLEAINNGYTVCFERMANFVSIMDKAAAGDRSSGFRLKNILKAQLVLIDEIGYTPISRSQANRFFTFISNCYRTTSVIFTTNKQVSEWAEVMGDADLTGAMLDRILSHAACFSLKGDSYRLKHPELFI